MKLSIRELNELIYCIAIARKHGALLGTKVADELEIKLRDELDNRLEADYLTTMLQDENRYGDSHYISNDGADEEPKKERGWIVQAILDYVDRKGAATHGQLEDYYKYITNSNSFSHCLINLKVPYKNRKTQRYLAKEGKPHSTAKWVVKVANPSNWVVVND